MNTYKVLLYIFSRSKKWRVFKLSRSIKTVVHCFDKKKKSKETIHLPYIPKMMIKTWWVKFFACSDLPSRRRQAQQKNIKYRLYFLVVVFATSFHSNRQNRKLQKNLQSARISTTDDEFFFSNYQQQTKRGKFFLKKLKSNAINQQTKKAWL